MDRFLADKTLSEYRVMLKKILRFKPHVLSETEEKLLAMQAEANQTAYKTFSALTNVDMSFGTMIVKAANSLEDSVAGHRPGIMI